MSLETLIFVKESTGRTLFRTENETRLADDMKKIGIHAELRNRSKRILQTRDILSNKQKAPECGTPQ